MADPASPAQSDGDVKSNMPILHVRANSEHSLLRRKHAQPVRSMCTAYYDRHKNAMSVVIQLLRLLLLLLRAIRARVQFIHIGR